MPVVKKKKRKMYFGQVTEDAIVRYNKSEDPILRNTIYNDYIQKPFEKLAENIIHTFKFYYFDVPSEDVKHEVVSFLVMNMHKYKEGKGKAFSYFSIVAKNYLILHNNNNYKKMKATDDLDVLDFSRNISSEQEQKVVKDYYEVFFDEMLEYWDVHLTELFKRKKDLNVADSVIYLFKNRDNIENFNKKALYILIRERTGSNTQHITRVINQMKKQYTKMQKVFQASGSVTNMTTGSYMNVLFS
jgi:hypothetical protein|tara:strand:- start:15498 stop:16229 length:732 start_codon:yes stop_codon:yes gene_type:complete